MSTNTSANTTPVYGRVRLTHLTTALRFLSSRGVNPATKSALMALVFQALAEASPASVRVTDEEEAREIWSAFDRGPAPGSSLGLSISLTRDEVATQSRLTPEQEEEILRSLALEEDGDEDDLGSE